MKKHLYVNLTTDESTNISSLAYKWHKEGDDAKIVDLAARGVIYGTARTVKGAKVETERERFDRVEGRERCKAIAEEIDAYSAGNMYRCPECGEIVEMPETVGDKFKCYHCEEVSEVDAFEQLSIYDYLDDILDIDFTVNRYKEYQSCSICIGWGGPNIYIDTDDAYIKLYWGSTREQYPIRYSTRDDIDEWAEEYFNCI